MGYVTLVVITGTNRGYYPGALSLSQATATHLKIYRTDVIYGCLTFKWVALTSTYCGRPANISFQKCSMILEFNTKNA